jgi:hypothetical protein
MKNIGSFPILPMSKQDAQNSNGSLSSYTLNNIVRALFNHLTTRDGQGESKMFDNVSTDAQVKN